MLAAAALRLAVIEALCPTAAIATGVGFPTLAQHRVYDGRTISSAELEAGASFTPSLSVYTEDTRIARRGDTATSARGNARCDVVIVAELAEIARNEEGEALLAPDGSEDTDAIINGDAGMQLVLDALTAQARATLVRAPAGAALRRIMKAASEIRIEPFRLPQFGVRFMRNVLTISAEIADDTFTDASGLPEPLRSIAAELPDGSYAKQRLAQLEAAFLATSRDDLEAIGFSTSGPPDPFL